MIATIVRTGILYVVVTVAIRLMGKRQIGDMQPNELVITLLISEIAAIPLQDSNQPVINGVAAISVLIFLEIMISSLSLKSRILRHLLNGKAVVLINNGVIDREAMKRVRVTADDLLEMARGKDVFDLDQIAFAILEVNGELNILLKSQYQTVTAKDMDIKNPPSYPYLPIIIDGKEIKENFDVSNVSEKEIDFIKGKERTKAENIFMLLYENGGKYKMIRKE